MNVDEFWQRNDFERHIERFGLIDDYKNSNQRQFYILIQDTLHEKPSFEAASKPCFLEKHMRILLSCVDAKTIDELEHLPVHVDFINIIGTHYNDCSKNTSE
mgnify:CR=1 FL=1